LAALQQTDERIRLRRCDPPQRVGVAVVERGRFTAERQIRASDIGPAIVGIEGDVDAVIVGAECLFEESRRANAKTNVASPRFD
jgi:hypothetical protein